MRVARPQPADLVVAGGVLLLAASFLPWYGLAAGGFITEGGSGGTTVTAWQTSPAWWGPVLAGAVVAGLAVLRRGDRLPAEWLPDVVVAVSLFGLLLVIGQAVIGIDRLGDFGWFAYAPPGGGLPELETGPRFGVWVAVAAIVLQLGAAWTLLRRERIA